MSIQVLVVHSCGHSATVSSPGPLDPEGLIQKDVVNGMQKLQLPSRPCIDCTPPAAAPSANPAVAPAAPGEYPLKDVAELYLLDGDARAVVIRCPNCGAKGSAWFQTTFQGKPGNGRVLWERTGETLETLSLHPSFLFVDHFHSWIRDGKLCIDSSFGCRIPKDAGHDVTTTQSA